MLAPLPPLASEILAGYVGGAAKTLAFYPLDTMTTLREVRVARRQSPLRYYAGLPLTLVAALPFAVIFHTAFWLCETLLDDKLPVAAIKLCASVCGAIASALVGVPFEMIKHRVQLGVTGYDTPRSAIQSTLRSDGVGGLYTGMSSTLARNVPYNALHFGIFELAATAWRSDMLAGAVAGAMTALLTTPLDLVNTRLQTQAISASLTGTSTNFTGVADALVTIWRDEGGPLALMRSAGIRMLQYAPSALVFFVVYGAIKRRF